LKSVKAQHHVTELFIGLLLVSFFTAFAAIEDVELILELRLDTLLDSSDLILFVTINLDEIAQTWALFALSDLYNDAHHDVFQGILTEALFICESHDVARHVQNIVTGELALLLQDLVLKDQQIATERLILILLDQLFHFVVRKNKQLYVGLASDVHVHVVLHKEGTVVDRGTFVELFEHKFVVLEFSIDLKNALFDEYKLIRGFFSRQKRRILVPVTRSQTEHEIKEHLVLMLCQVLDSFDHTKDKLNFFVSIVLNGVGFKSDLVLRKFGLDHVEALFVDTCESIIVLRNDRSAALAFVEQSNLTEVVTFFQHTAPLLAAVLISDFNFALA